MITELPLELAGHAIDRRRHVRGLCMGSERLARDVQRRFDTLHAVERGIVLGDELEVDPGCPGLHALEVRELVARDLPNLVGHRETPAGEGQIHRRSVVSSSLGRALERLTWSFAPHPPAGVLALRPRGPRLPPSLARRRGRTYI